MSIAQIRLEFVYSSSTLLEALDTVPPALQSKKQFDSIKRYRKLLLSGIEKVKAALKEASSKTPDYNTICTLRKNIYEIKSKRIEKLLDESPEATCKQKFDHVFESVFQSVQKLERECFAAESAADTRAKDRYFAQIINEMDSSRYAWIDSGILDPAILEENEDSSKLSVMASMIIPNSKKQAQWPFMIQV
jgi:hypothetical protein